MLIPHKHTNKKLKLNKTEALINSALALILVLLSVGSVFFFIIPNINEMFKLKRELDQQTQEVQLLEKKQIDINSYTVSQLNDLYNKTLLFIPENINLGTMGASINSVAKGYNLTIQRLTLTEEPQSRNIKIPGMDEKSSLTLPVKSITAPFVMQGHKQDLLDFINTITTSLEAREFNTVQLSETNDNSWTLKLQLTHLYMDYIKDVPLNPTLPLIDKKLVKELEKEIAARNLETPTPTPPITTNTQENTSHQPTPTISGTPSISPTATQ